MRGNIYSAGRTNGNNLSILTVLVLKPSPSYSEKGCVEPRLLGIGGGPAIGTSFKVSSSTLVLCHF
jgi:hypothetical protein